MNELASTLTAARVRSRKDLAGVDLSAIVGRDGVRRVQDVLAHVGAWEREVATSIRAGLDGGTHTLPLPLDLDGQNEVYHAAHVDLAPDAAWALWEDGRRELAEAAGRAGAGFSFTCPWGKVETIERVVEDMIEHEETHVARIRERAGAAS